MRNLILTLTLLCSICSYGQNTFAPAGAEWFHDMTYGIFHSHAEKDTVINGQQCRKVTQRAGLTPFHVAVGPHVGDLPTTYLYSSANEDTVFIYNSFKQGFTPLYVFNVSVGDTICLPLFPPQGGALQNITDSSFCLLVDSVKMVSYDTATLKTVYITSLDINGKAEYSYGGQYAQHLGNINTGLLPNCMNCVFPLSDSYQSPTGLRCYNDSSLAVKLVNDTCNRGIKASIGEMGQQNLLKLHPNPAKDRITLGGLSSVHIRTLAVTDISGQVLIKMPLDNLSGDSIPIDISSLAPGVYQLTATDKETIYKTRFIVLPH